MGKGFGLCARNGALRSVDLIVIEGRGGEGGGQQVDLDEDEGVEGRMDGPGWWLRGQRVRGQGREDGDGKGGKGGKTGSGGSTG